MEDNRILLIESPVSNAKLIKRDDQLIKESVTLSELQNLPEGITDESILIQGVVQRADVENKNRRIYPKNILEKERRRLTNLIESGVYGIVGELDHSDSNAVSLKNSSIAIRKLWWEGNDLVAIAELFDPKYNANAGIAYSILKAGMPLGISSRGLGSLSYVNGINMVQEDYEMVCWDLVSDPSTHSAYMRKIPVQKIKESVENNIIKPKETKRNKIDEIVRDLLWEF